MDLLAKLFIVSVLSALVGAEFPFDYNLETDIEETIARNDNSFRLPEEFDPIHCIIEITPYFQEAPEDHEPFTFYGEATHTIKPLEDGLTAVTLQDNVRQIISVSLTNQLNESLEHDSDPFERIRDLFFLKVNLKDGITLVKDEEYTLFISYIGNINETPLSRGMFRGNYVDENGELRWYAATHLQPTHSRQLFPSFDEPGFKSTFDIIVHKPSHFTTTFSNMPVKEKLEGDDPDTDVFYTTPRMSAYLISIHISEGFEVIADNNSTEKSYRIIARPTAKNQGGYALEVGPPLTQWFDDYLGIEYYKMAEGLRNDQLATPFWASGATENWGLVSYREVRLLYEQGETNALDKMYIGTITAHELAHKWFGNYITCRWWDNVWINEGFASYFEYFAMDGVDKSMELEDQFNVMYLQSALASDATVGTRALRHPVNSPTEVTGHFSGISYTKGASLLLMLKHFVTEDVFKKALNLFLVDRAYEHAFPEDLYRAFLNATSEAETPLASGVNIETFMSTWVDQRGYPVLEVEVDYDEGEISLKQERFYINENTEQTNEIWPLPLTFTTGKDADWDNLTVSYVLTTKEDKIPIEPGQDWVIFNLQQKGIYRVNYDDHSWALIAKALDENPNNYHHLNRAQIVDDIFALMRSGRLSYEVGFEVLQFLKKEDNFLAWYPAVSGFTWLRNRFLHLPEVLEEFDELLEKYMDKVVDTVGFNVRINEPLTRTLNRIFTLSLVCNIGLESCVNDALAKFKEFVDNNTPVDPNLRRHVFCIGLREGDYNDWKHVYDRMLASNNQADEVAMLRSLGCTTNERAVNEMLEIITKDEVKAQDRTNAFAWLFAGGKNNAHLALQYLKTNQNAIKVRDALILPANFQSVLASLASNLDSDGLTDMETWIQANSAAIPDIASGLSAIQSARANMEWGSAKAEEVLKGMRSSAAVLVPTTLMLLASLLTFLLK